MDIKRSIKSGWLTNTLLQYIRIYMNIHFSLKKKIILLQFHFTLFDKNVIRNSASVSCL